MVKMNILIACFPLTRVFRIRSLINIVKGKERKSIYIAPFHILCISFKALLVLVMVLVLVR